MNFRNPFTAGLASAFLALTALPSAADEFNVVASFSILGDMVEEVTGVVGDALDQSLHRGSNIGDRASTMQTTQLSPNNADLGEIRLISTPWREPKPCQQRLTFHAGLQRRISHESQINQ